MRGAVLYGPHDIRFEDRETPKIVEPTDAVIRIAVTCVCGSDLWGRIGGCNRSTDRRRWGTNTAASSRRWAALSS
jgi:threonine dehydrogenase-like Zn-dependent dehydrogenase